MTSSCCGANADAEVKLQVAGKRLIMMEARRNHDACWRPGGVLLVSVGGVGGPAAKAAHNERCHWQADSEAQERQELPGPATRNGTSKLMKVFSRSLRTLSCIRSPSLNSIANGALVTNADSAPRL
jgi:hypothetical protein